METDKGKKFFFSFTLDFEGEARRIDGRRLLCTVYTYKIAFVNLPMFAERARRVSGDNNNKYTLLRQVQTLLFL